MDSAKQYCDLVIKPLEEKRNQIRNKENLTGREKEILEKYDNVILEKYKKLEEIIEKQQS